jgi:hypothetical protein
VAGALAFRDTRIAELEAELAALKGEATATSSFETPASAGSSG